MLADYEAHRDLPFEGGIDEATWSLWRMFCARCASGRRNVTMRGVAARRDAAGELRIRPAIPERMCHRGEHGE